MGIYKSCPCDLHLASEGLGEMFEGHFVDKWANKIPLVSMRAACAWADTGPTPIFASKNVTISFQFKLIIFLLIGPPYILQSERGGEQVD